MRSEKYPLLVFPLSDEDGGGFFAESLDIPGVGVDAETPQEAISDCLQVIEDILSWRQEKGLSLPSPGNYSTEAYSGRFVLRIPKSLHRRLSLKAKQEGVSLNHLCATYLVEGMVRDQQDQKEMVLSSSFETTAHSLSTKLLLSYVKSITTHKRGLWTLPPTFEDDDFDSEKGGYH